MAKAINWKAVYRAGVQAKAWSKEDQPVKISETPIPQFWVRNIEKLRPILDTGIVYFDLIARPESHSVFASSIKYGHPGYKENSIEMFLIHRNTKKMQDNNPKLGSFIEPAACASILTVLGIEVYYSIDSHWHDDTKKQSDDDSYFSFSEIVFAFSNQEKQDALGTLLGGTFLGDKPEVSNSLPPVFVDHRKYISDEELNA